MLERVMDPKVDESVVESGAILFSMVDSLVSEAAALAREMLGVSIGDMIEGSLVPALVRGSFVSGFLSWELSLAKEKGARETRESLGHFVFCLVGQRWSEEVIEKCHKAGSEAAETCEAYVSYLFLPYPRP